MDINELLHPEDYNLAGEESWTVPSSQEQSEIKSLIAKETEVENTILEDFIEKRILYKLENKEFLKDKLYFRQRLDKKNLSDIKDILETLDQYEDIKFKILLNPGNKSLDISASNAIEQIYNILRNLTNDVSSVKIKPGRRPKWNLNINTADLIFESFYFININSPVSFSKNKKFFIAGLILVLVGRLDSLAKYEATRKPSDLNESYKVYLIQNCKKAINGIGNDDKNLLHHLCGYNEDNDRPPLQVDKRIANETLRELFGNPEIYLPPDAQTTLLS